MSKSPPVSGKKLVKALSKIGYYVRNQKGSHIHLRHPVKPPLTVPNHKQIKKGTLKAILNVVGYTLPELRKLM